MRMSLLPSEASPQKIQIPQIPAIYVNARQAFLIGTDGEIKTLSHEAAKRAIHQKPVLVCHAPYTCARLGIDSIFAFDVLELFAFVHPATFTVPTPVGLAKAVGVSIPTSTEDYPYALIEITQALLSDIRFDKWRGRADPMRIARVMGQNGKGWVWTPFIFSAFGQTYDEKETVISVADLNVWKSLPEWSEGAPPPPETHHPITGDEARQKLASVLGTGAEERQAQMSYTTAMTGMFAPVANDGVPNGVLIEAGTGVGKTLGYLSPASVWADKNQGSVWISTYTKNLQRQIGQELDKLYPNAELKDAKVAIRKGRENYLCLLNLEEISAGAALAKHPNVAIAAGIMARWAAATNDGDLSGSDFPGWITGLMGYNYTNGLADKRGECIYSACDHYHRCFVEKSIRKARYADLVIANHALVMIQTADSNADTELPHRYIFDEGHHLFDAADSAYGGHLSALETHDLRRWIRGSEGGKKTRARGLKRRAESLVTGNEKLELLLQDVVEAARVLTSEGWAARLKEGQPKEVCESFIHEVYKQVFARADGRDGPYSLETATHPIDDDVLRTAAQLKEALSRLQKPMMDMVNAFRKKLIDEADTIEADDRRRLDAIIGSMGVKSNTIMGWMAMLESLAHGAVPEQFVDWMEIERIDGRAYDIGLYRHWVDPMVPFAASLQPHAHGVAVTSATLRDGTNDPEENWRVARDLSGFSHLNLHAQEESFESPFDYPARTKIFVINDVRKDDLDQVASAYRSLFEAARGGALGLFTAISRLRAVHQKIAAPLEDKGLHLYAQHVDMMDNGTLVDIFRDDVNACLLGTDAVRDGVDVPGDSLRLIVFDRVPWPRPTLLHKARREAFGSRQYDERLARLKLKQAFGRLIRRADDRGVFVMLDSMLPSRLHGAFPPGVEVVKCGLKEASAEIQKFLA